jgi:hypothetical protein
MPYKMLQLYPVTPFFWVHLVRRPPTGLLYQPRLIGDECGAVGGMRIGGGNQSTRRQPAPVLLSPPQIPHDLTWARTGLVAMGNRRLTAWAMAQLYITPLFILPAIITDSIKTMWYKPYPYVYLKVKESKRWTEIKI